MIDSSPPCLTRGVSFDVTQVAGVMLCRARAAMVFMRRIEMPAGGRRIGRGAITFVVNMETVFARFQALDVSDYPDVVASLRKRDGAGNLAARGST